MSHHIDATTVRHPRRLSRTRQRPVRRRSRDEDWKVPPPPMRRSAGQPDGEMNPRSRVVLADGFELVRAGLRAAVELDSQVAIVGEAGHLRQALGSYATSSGGPATSATRFSVHRSFPYPLAWAPWMRALPTWASCSGRNFGSRLARSTAQPVPTGTSPRSTPIRHNLMTHVKLTRNLGRTQTVLEQVHRAHAAFLQRCEVASLSNLLPVRALLFCFTGILVMRQSRTNPYASGRANRRAISQSSLNRRSLDSVSIRVIRRSGGQRPSATGSRSR
jgi:hypothetical protein